MPSIEKMISAQLESASSGDRFVSSNKYCRQFTASRVDRGVVFKRVCRRTIKNGLHRLALQLVGRLDIDPNVDLCCQILIIGSMRES